MEKSSLKEGKMRESRVLTILKKIPVYPESIWVRPQDSYNFATTAPLYEDDNGNISYVSQEAKDEYLRNYSSRTKGETDD